VELTNYRSDFENGKFLWEVELHHSQGKDKAKVYKPNITMWAIPSPYKESIRDFIVQTKKAVPDMNTFQSVFCMTTDDREKQKYYGPYELLESIKAFIDSTFSPEEQKKYVRFGDEPNQVPLAIAAGYMILKQTVTHMGRLQ
jgi:DNA (cytosine-5)-methyltransferase 1